ncbi:hypothetical protein Fbal_0906 [Ferrimonas balearica DSM 9799]|uniref:Uncharacterized protein n=1 Tax=Ferrimonas balearica (strain DSM 9799 / CCM 4581 / KCTC 23876 / PAT) TaxID=550540 RepID=E1STI2_FERBD|nr:hypothetical protein [Ferrimonas balearica]MBY6018112.1 hypothetical protein [Halomonas denitrificans]ADN75115.1 hypothetical protein Fbal_0906 [Ferrimonas balearica DSM 9799]MBW3138011.1 hypothetical protein [Ferrimonas balearica]MBW3164423.1 hypothetical protein [Ferrimonas balearica]MBY5978778.1 hypothetical protein [Ferrimonas balearica]
MRIRSLYRQLFTAVFMLGVVTLVLFTLAFQFNEAKPMRDVERFDQYAGEKTYCRTLNHYQAKQKDKTVDRLIESSDHNAMDFILWRFGKEKGTDMVRTCEKAKKAHIVERCEQQPELSIEQVILEYNRPAIVAKGYI